MISFRWNNFKCFPDTGWVDIKPLTILIGPNNSGKTSLITPLLLLKQTLECGSDKVPLKINGNLYNAGSYEDLIFNHDSSLPLNLSIRFHHHDIEDSEKLSDIDETPPGEISICFSSRQNLSPNDIQLEKVELSDVFGRPILKREKDSEGNFSLEYSQSKNLDSKIIKLIKNDKPERFYFTDNLIRDILKDSILKEDQKKARKKRITFKPFSLDEATTFYLAMVSFVENEIKDLFDNIKFVGPIREEPKRLYEFSGEPPRNVGIKGEYTYEIIARGLSKENLNSVKKWISAFEFGGTLSSKKGPYNTFFLEIKKRNKSCINLADMGFGFSQVLPLIIQSTILPKDGILITEQPEIHLNPKLQCTLADLFIETVKSGKKVLVETHSEHIILRLRRLVAEKKISSEDIRIYFIEKDGIKSIIKNIPIQTNGHISKESWPTGFFEDSLREALGLAASQANGD